MAGFLDFNTKFVADSFEKGAKCRYLPSIFLNWKGLRIIRRKCVPPILPGFWRMTKRLSPLIRSWRKVSGFDSVALPAVFGLSSAAPVRKTERSVDIPVWLIPTMLPSVPGIRALSNSCRSFEALGGVYMLAIQWKADLRATECRRYIPSIMGISRLWRKTLFLLPAVISAMD